MEPFTGVISNCKKEILTHTSGEIKIETHRNWFNVRDESVWGGGGRITTTHEHYTNFELDGVAFRCYGDLVFKDGDRVKFYAIDSGKGYHVVHFLNNFTRGFYKGETPRTYGLFERGWSAAKTFAIDFVVTFFLSLFIAPIVWLIFGLGETFNVTFWTLLVIVIVDSIFKFKKKKDYDEKIRNIYNTLTSDK